MDSPVSLNIPLTFPDSLPANTVSPTFNVPEVIKTVATAPLPFSILDSIMTPLPGASKGALRSKISACSKIDSSKDSIPSPVSADTFTKICSPPHSSGMIS